MLKSLGKILVLSSILIVANSSFGYSINSYPYNERFDTEAYVNQLVYLTGDASHVWVPNGGWRGGAAKFFPPSQSDRYGGLGAFALRSAGDNTQINLRFLIKHGSTYASSLSDGNKMIIIHRESQDGTDMGSSSRVMSIEKKYGSGASTFTGYSACSNIHCQYENRLWWLEGNETFRIGAQDRAEEWISVEIEANTVTGDLKLYIDTQDGQFSGQFVELNLQDEGPGLGGIWSYISVIGGYWSASAPDPDNYFMIDELVIDSSYIGPPEGFVGAGAAPMPPVLR